MRHRIAPPAHRLRDSRSLRPLRAVFIAAPIIALLATLPACTTPLAAPNLGSLYNRAAAHHDPTRNPVIVIPGILGTRLEHESSGRVVWGDFGGTAADPATPDGARLIALPMRPGAALADLHDDVVPTGVLDRARLNLLGLPLSLSAYAQILATLGVGGYRDEQLGKAGAVDYGDDHYTCFQFGYDWRRDNVENARRLHAFILVRRAYVQQQIEQRYGIRGHDVKFDIVAHSMGGLVARWYLMYGDAELPADGLPELTWAGARYVDRVILVGTPNAGSAKSLVNLVDGAKFGWVRYDPAVLGTMPSIYQLMPRPRHAAVVRDADPADVLRDTLDPAAWERRGWGLLDKRSERVLARLLPDVPDPATRREVARDHVAKCLARAGRFFAALDRPAAAPPGLKLHLFAGDAVPTPAVLSVDGRTGRLKPLSAAPGDGTVLRSSALLDERVGGEWRPAPSTPIAWSGVHFLFTDHIGLTRDPAFADNVLHLLLESP